MVNDAFRPNKIKGFRFEWKFENITLDNLNVIHGGMEFVNVSSRNVKVPLVLSRDRGELMLSDLNAYRSKISFEIETYIRK